MKTEAKAMCRECPFRRKSLPGYLGDSTVDDFLDLTLRIDIGMPCHLSIDYEDTNWRDTVAEKARRCRGSLVFYKNMCKLPIDKEHAAAVSRVERDTVNVFANTVEFLSHHKSVVTQKVSSKVRREEVARRKRRQS